MARDALDDLLTECDAYLIGQTTLLFTLYQGADVALYRVAAEAQLEQLVAAVQHARSRRSPNQRCDPGG